MSERLTIGSVSLSSRLTLAPLAGFGDVAFRELCAECGAGLTTTEMVSVNGLVYDNEKTKGLLARSESEKVCALQLFGNDPQTFYRAIREHSETDGFEIVDINMGCPMPKITGQGSGSALLGDIERAKDIVAACVESSARPVTVKMRLGIRSDKSAEEFALSMQKAGAAALTVHGRTAEQMYTGSADWHAIALVKAAVDIPVIGNGDIVSYDGAMSAMRDFGVDGVAIGRGALGNPGVFGKREDAQSLAIKQIDLMARYFSESYALVAFRKHAVHYFKGVRGGKSARAEIMAADSLEELKAAVRKGLYRG